MNKFIELANIVERNIVCDVDIANKKSNELIALCKQNNIAMGKVKKKDDFDAYVFCWGPRPFKDDQGILSVQYICPLFAYFDFYHVSWNDFISLVNGTYKIKSPEEYKALLEEQDKPRKPNLEHHWNFLCRQPNVNLTSLM